MNLLTKIKSYLDDLYFKKVEEKFNRAIYTLDDILICDYGYPEEFPEEDCNCPDSIQKSISPESYGRFVFLVNLISEILPRELGECHLSFSNCGGSLVIRPEEDSCECDGEEPST